MRKPQSVAPPWHMRFGHPSDEVLKHIPSHTEGVGFDNAADTKQPSENCALSDVSRQISRRPVAQGDRPWQEVCLTVPFLSRHMTVTLACYIFTACSVRS